MRIGSLTFYESSLLGMQQQQSNISRLSQQISTNQRMLQPSDDPVDAVRALSLSDSVAQRSQFIENQLKAEITLKYEKATLDEINQAMLDVRQIMVQLSPSMDNASRVNLSSQIGAAFNRLYALANTQDSDGNYIFSGDKAKTQTYATVTPVGVGPNYTKVVGFQGTQGINTVTIEAGRTVQVNDAGPAVFGNIFETLYNIKQIVDVSGSDPESDANFAGDVGDSFNFTQADITTALNGLDSAIQRVSVVSNRVVGALIDVGSAKTTTTSYLNLDKDSLSDINGLDQAAAIIELQSRQTSLEAAQRAFARVSGSNLFDFL
ncbi:MAG: flagellar hook-associated protein FlgL [Betaproteobacteria bacterium]|nr:flagellar hook-associated protein FlgL [Betaproteobacteria bacterium]